MSGCFSRVRLLRIRLQGIWWRCLRADLNFKDGNVEVLKLVNGGVMNGIMNVSSKGNEGSRPSALLNCLHAYWVHLVWVHFDMWFQWWVWWGVVQVGRGVMSQGKFRKHQECQGRVRLTYAARSDTQAWQKPRGDGVMWRSSVINTSMGEIVTTGVWVSLERGDNSMYGFIMHVGKKIIRVWMGAWGGWVEPGFHFYSPCIGWHVGEILCFGTIVFWKFPMYSPCQIFNNRETCASVIVGEFQKLFDHKWWIS